jgi:hypothetical protein
MIYKKGYRYFFSVNTFGRSVRSKHTEIAAQGDVTLSRRNMLPIHDFIPFAILNTILTVKKHSSNHCRRGLHTVSLVKPQKEHGKYEQKQNSGNQQMRFIYFLKFVFKVHHLLLLQSKEKFFQPNNNKIISQIPRFFNRRKRNEKSALPTMKYCILQRQLKIIKKTYALFFFIK